jgi:hypothetical protein
LVYFKEMINALREVVGRFLALMRTRRIRHVSVLVLFRFHALWPSLTHMHLVEVEQMLALDYDFSNCIAELRF